GRHRPDRRRPLSIAWRLNRAANCRLDVRCRCDPATHPFNSDATLLWAGTARSAHVAEATPEPHLAPLLSPVAQPSCSAQLLSAEKAGTAAQRAGRHPARTASSSEQNQRLPFARSILTLV